MTADQMDDETRLRVLEACVEPADHREVAEQAGTTPDVVLGLYHDPAFRRALAEARAVSLAASAAQLDAAAAGAMRRLVQLVQSDDDQVALKAAERVLALTVSGLRDELERRAKEALADAGHAAEPDGVDRGSRPRIVLGRPGNRPPDDPGPGRAG